MKGLELARKYYEEYGKAMIEEQFSEYADRIAVGLVGEGSECSGFDDKISRDHDFEPCFCLWITADDERKFGFKLERAYAKLPREFMGFRRQIMSPVGGNRHGVMTVDSFYTKFLGAGNAPDSIERWLYTPAAMLKAASNGEVWRDDLGVFSQVRAALSKGYPEDIRRKKIAAHTIMMSQSGQYNFMRCIERGEIGAAQLAVFEFVRHAISTVYLLNNEYEPFYKWAYRGMRKLSVLGSVEEELVFLTQTGNSEKEAERKADAIESLSSKFIDEFRNQSMTKATCGNLNSHAYSIVDSIKDGQLRNMHIMDGID